MEAPEFLAFLRRWVIGIVGIIVFGAAYPFSAADYEISAHAALTQAIFNFHNKSFPASAIPEEHRYDVVRGAMDEDDGTRSLYHFYDPISGKGLHFGGKRFMPATDWARLKTAPQNIYTWDAALAAYAAGDEKTAFVALGHVLHLLEDLGVPEHARNDAHPINSPYEQFTKNLVPATPAKPPIVLGDMRAHFVALAKYSNEHFYSADTMDGEYAKPTPENFKRDGDYEYALAMIDGEKYYLAQVINGRFNYSSNSGAKKLFIDDGFSNKKILSDYWRLLSAHTIRHGAGLVHLFLAEGEKLRVAEAAQAKDRQRVVAKGTLANITEAFAPFFGGSDSEDGLTEDGEVDATDGVFSPAVPSAGTAKKKTSGAGDESEKPGALRTAAKSSASVPKPTPAAICTYAGVGASARLPIVINEVAWMGSKSSAADEWIELKNVSGALVDIAGWQIASAKGRIEIVFPEGSAIPAGGFYLLERTGDDAVPSIKADMIYQGALSNTDDGLHLYAPGCVLIDAAEAAPAWPAGNAAERRTMEREASGAWHSYAASASSTIFGTPKRENGPPPAIVAAPPKQTAVGGSGGTGTSAAPLGASSPSGGSSASAQSVLAGNGTVLINEILFDAEGADAGKEFIELLNPGSAAVDLAGWSIQTQTAKKNFEDGNVIPALGCFLVTMGSGAPQPALGMRWASGSLNNTAGTAYVVRDQEFVSGDGDADIADRAAYSNTLTGFAPGTSVERGDNGALHVRDAPNPGDCSHAGGSALSASSAGSGAAPSPSGGTASSPSSAGFLKKISFYPDPASDGSLIDLQWDHYPFVPGGTDGMKALVFYKNTAPATTPQVNTATDWSVDDPHVMSVKYQTYCGAGCVPVRPSLVLPDTPAMSQSGYGAVAVAYDYALLAEDSMARLKAAPASPGDYITVAYYDLAYSLGGNQSFTLVAADPTRYYFDDPKPVHLAPVLSGGTSTAFDFHRSVLTITLPLATDADSRDTLLSYHFSLNGRTVGGGFAGGHDYSFVVAAGDAFDISYAAADEFNVRSASAGDEWSFPGAVSWGIVQDHADGQTFTLGQADQNCASCERSASYQTISFPADTPVNAVSIRIKSDRGAIGATLRMGLYDDAGGAPRSAPLAEQALDLGDEAVGSNQDISFLFDSPVTLRADTPYWLKLDVAEYRNPADQYAPYLYQRISSGDPYPGGSSAWRTTVRFIPDFPGGSDWQMKVGLWEK